MKFSPRERKLLTFLGILLVLVLYINFFLRPQMKLITKLKDEISTYTKNYEVNKVIKEKVEKMDSDIKILSQKLKDLRAVFPPVINYDEVLICVRDLARNSGLDVDSISFVEPAEVAKEEVKPTQGDTKKTPADKSASQQAQITDTDLKSLINKLGMVGASSIPNDTGEQKRVIISDGKGYVLGIKLNAVGTNEQIKKFMHGVSALKNKVSFKDMQINNGANGILTSSITLDFYGIMDKNAGEYTMLPDGTWIPLKAKGTDNMFLPYDGYIGLTNSVVNPSNTTQNSLTTGSNSTEIWKYDFSMRVVPFGDNMAPPTVSMVCTNSIQVEGNYRVPVIYGDNKNEEYAELYVEEKDGKFYFKFRTENDAFPDTAYAQLAEFKPVENEIKMLIDSTPRKFNEDVGGVNINVINKTSKNFTIKVINEDKQKPRVKVNKSGQNVTVRFE